MVDVSLWLMPGRTPPGLLVCQVTAVLAAMLGVPEVGVRVIG